MYPSEFPFVFHHQRRMAQHHRFPFFHTRLFQMFSGFQEMADILKDPRISFRRPSDHHTVTARLCPHCKHILRTGNVTVANYRHRHCFFDLPDHIPVRLSVIILFSCSSMHRDCRNACLLRDPCHLQRIDMLCIKACPDLDRNWKRNRMHQCIDNISDQLWLFHQRGTFAVVDDLRNRASHVDIDKRKSLILQSFCL